MTSRTTLPPLNPDKSTSGIALDPKTLERVIPQSKRPDGTVRKEIKIRPGYTPQEDVRRFRGTKQAQMDSNALPKGHIIGWAPPPGASNTPRTKPTTPKPNAAGAGLSGAAKKNAKRRQAKKESTVDPKEDWDDASDPEPEKSSATSKNTSDKSISAEADDLEKELEKLKM